MYLRRIAHPHGLTSTRITEIYPALPKDGAIARKSLNLTEK
jgi:hypothetical protein